MEEPHGPGKSDEPGAPGKQGSQRKGGKAEGQAPKPLGVVSKLGMEEPHGPGKSDEPGKSDGITSLADGSAIDQAKDPKAVWRYTLGGEKLGPVTFERLRELADNRVLSPRTDMVWKDGFGSWMTAGEVKGLFHRSALAEAKSGNKNSGRRRKSRSARSAKQAQDEKKLPPLGARKMVGIPRRVFIPLFVAFPLVWPMALQFLLRISDGSLPADLEQAAESYGFFVPLFVALVLLAARLANIGMNRIWIIGFAVPLLNLWLGYLCFACPSHYMTYRKLGRGGMVLALLYWTTVVASIAGAGYLAFTFISAAGDPEHQEQWELLRESLPWLPEITSDE